MSSDEDIAYEPYEPTVRRRPHSRQRDSDSSSDSEEGNVHFYADHDRARAWRRERLINWWRSADYRQKRRVKGAKFGYVDAEDEEGREFQVPCCTSCGKSWCDTLTCKRNPIKKCTSCSENWTGNEYELKASDNYYLKNRTCRTRQPPTVGIVDPRARYGGRSRKRTKRKKRRKTKKKTRRKKRRKTKKRRRTKRK